MSKRSYLKYDPKRDDYYYPWWHAGSTFGCFLWISSPGWVMLLLWVISWLAAGGE